MNKFNLSIFWRNMLLNLPQWQFLYSIVRAVHYDLGLLCRYYVDDVLFCVGPQMAPEARPRGAPMSTLDTYEVAFCMRARVPPRLPILRSYVAVLDNRVPASTTNSKVRIHVSRLNLKLPKNDPSLSSSVHHVIADRTEAHHRGDVEVACPRATLITWPSHLSCSPAIGHTSEIILPVYFGFPREGHELINAGQQSFVDRKYKISPAFSHVFCTAPKRPKLLQHPKYVT